MSAHMLIRELPSIVAPSHGPIEVSDPVSRVEARGWLGKLLIIVWGRKTTVIVALSVVGIILNLVLRFSFHASSGAYQTPLLATLVIGGLPLLFDLFRKLIKREFGPDLLGGISAIILIVLGEYFAGSIIVLMLAGGNALESYALRSAPSALAARAWRMPSVAHRKGRSEIVDVALLEVSIGDTPGGNRRHRRAGPIACRLSTQSDS
jgi:cation transport ATPase